MRLIQVVPGRTSRQEGVGGYAQALAAELAAEHSVTTEWLAPRDGRDFAGSLAQTGADTVLLHYSGYGFATRGCPTWLPTTLAEWRSGNPRRRLITMFHEVYATGKPWHSSFWLSQLQRRIAARLVRTSNVLLTSLELYKTLLNPWADGRSIRVVPVVSTVGELAEPLALAARQRRLIVFGGAGRRRNAYAATESLLAASAALGIEELVDVGPPIEVPGTVGRVPVRSAGLLAPAEVSLLLRDSVAGFLAYAPSFLGKSTIFAAYCAHGMLPVCACAAISTAAEVRADEHYWRPERSRSDDGGRWQRIAAAAHGWYFGHALSRQAEQLMASLK